MPANEKTAWGEDTREITVPPGIIESAMREQPLLRGLMVIAAGFSSKPGGTRGRSLNGDDEAVFAYCVRGSGWCAVGGCLRAFRAGSLLVLPRGTPHDFSPQGARPPTVHWVRAIGQSVPAYLRVLGVSAGSPVLQVGEDSQLVRLFGEIHHSLEQRNSFSGLLRAAGALAYLLSLVIQKQEHRPREELDAVRKVAEAIIFMSEHLDQPLRVSALARIASLSPDYFAQLFKAQTGCSPRDYLHLLRIHSACQLLANTTLNIKQIATQLGYQDQFHFSHKFKGFQGLSPSEYRRQQPR